MIVIIYVFFVGNDSGLEFKIEIYRAAIIYHYKHFIMTCNESACFILKFVQPPSALHGPYEVMEGKCYKCANNFVKWNKCDLKFKFFKFENKLHVPCGSNKFIEFKLDGTYESKEQFDIAYKHFYGDEYIKKVRYYNLIKREETIIIPELTVVVPEVNLPVKEQSWREWLGSLVSSVI